MSSLRSWISVEQLSDYIGISKETIYRWLEKKKIPGHKVGTQWRFQPDEIDQWIKAGDAQLVGQVQPDKVLQGWSKDADGTTKNY